MENDRHFEIWITFVDGRHQVVPPEPLWWDACIPRTAFYPDRIGVFNAADRDLILDWYHQGNDVKKIDVITI